MVHLKASGRFLYRPFTFSQLQLGRVSLCLHRVICRFDVIDIRCMVIIVIEIRCHC